MLDTRARSAIDVLIEFVRNVPGPTVYPAEGVAAGLLQRLLDGSKVIDFDALIMASGERTLFAAENEGIKETISYDQAEGSYIDDIAQAADHVVEQLAEVAHGRT